MQTLPARVGERLRSFRKNRGLTQEQLGEMVQLPQSYIGGIERGEKNISLETLDKIITALEINPEDVLRSDLSSAKLIDKVTLLLRNRDPNEILIIHNLIADVLKAFDARRKI